MFSELGKSFGSFGENVGRKVSRRAGKVIFVGENFHSERELPSAEMTLAFPREVMTGKTPAILARGNRRRRRAIALIPYPRISRAEKDIRLRIPLPFPSHTRAFQGYFPDKFDEFPPNRTRPAGFVRSRRTGLKLTRKRWNFSQAGLIRPKRLSRQRSRIRPDFHKPGFPFPRTPRHVH